MSSTVDKVEAVDMLGREDSERGGLISRSCGCGCFGDRGLGGRGDETEIFELVSYDMEGNALRFIGSRRVVVRGHLRNCGASTLCLEIRRGCSRGLGNKRCVESLLVRVGEWVKK
jgi:hypothetical protein